MKVLIEEGCIGCGACESFCADVFKVEDVCVVDESKIAGNEDTIKDAADACPVSVITISE